MFAVYRLFALLAAPVLVLWMRWFGPGDASMRRCWPERLGRIPARDEPVIWIHAASVGEVNAVQALVKALHEAFPEHPVVISTFTATGRARAAEVFGSRAEVVYAPVDTIGVAGRWLTRVQPTLGLIVETEIWPELFRQCRKRNLPLLMVNARLSASAMRRYMRFRSLFATALGAVEQVACQSEQEAERFGRLGMDPDRLSVVGNLKFDMPIPDEIGQRVQQLRARWGDRPVWVAGSTRPGEEEIILRAHARLRQMRENALLVLAPRHPERCPDVRGMIEQAGMSCQSIEEEITAETEVVLVDRIGVLLACYAASPAAFVGGSLVDIGGHNLLEPAAFGKVVIAGRHLHQQAGSAAALKSAGGLVEVTDDADLAAAVAETWSDPETALARGRAALGVFEQGRGSVRRTLRLIRDSSAGKRLLSPSRTRAASR